MNQTTTQKNFTWTQRGKQRVAEAIKATLKYNRLKGLHPNSIRELGRFAGFGESHTSVLKYARANVDDPNHFQDDCRVLRSIAPYIYVVNEFFIENDKIAQVNHATPDLSVALPYYQQEVTYGDNWEEFVRLGEQGCDYLEYYQELKPQLDSKPLSSMLQKVMVDAQVSRKLSSLISIEKLVEIIDEKYFPSKPELEAIAPLLGIPLERLIWFRNYQYGIGIDSLDKTKFTSLAQVITDFLGRVNTVKETAWTIEQLAIALKSDVSGLSILKLTKIVEGDQPTLDQVTEADLSRLEKVFQDHAVFWTQEELLSILRIGQYLGTDQSQEEGNGKKATNAVNGDD